MKGNKPNIGRPGVDGVLKRRRDIDGGRESLAEFLARGGDIVVAPPAEYAPSVREVTASPRVYGYVMLNAPSAPTTSDGRSRIPDHSEIRRAPEAADETEFDIREDLYDVTHRTAGTADDDE